MSLNLFIPGISFNNDENIANSLEYNVINESGPAHDRVFEVEVVIGGITYGKGIGKSKKEAEQKAAYDAYRKQAK